MSDVHSHKCKKCARIWTHERLINSTEEEYRIAHTCDDCGAVQYAKHLQPGEARELLLQVLLALAKTIAQERRDDSEKR